MWLHLLHAPENELWCGERYSAKKVAVLESDFEDMPLSRTNLFFT
jgi:hypothetical protein